MINHRGIFTYNCDGNKIYKYYSKINSCYSSIDFIDNEQILVYNCKQCEIKNINIYSNKDKSIYFNNILPIKILKIKY